MSEIIIGNRIPKNYFITKGCGESDITLHAGSYHLALRVARIEMCNIMTYSSILPKIANKIKRPNILTHGSVMETIMAVAHTNCGDRCTAGIIYGWLYDKKSNEKYGGLVCEHNGSYSIPQIKDLLCKSLNELYVNGYSDDYELKDVVVITKSFKPKKQFGTALVALCFVDYVYPKIA